MNHDCSGDIFVRHGKNWGRCLADSALFELREGLEFCPNCERPWMGTVDLQIWDPDQSEDVLIKIDLPHFKFLAEERARKIAHLEAELETWKKMYKDQAGIKSF